MDCRKILILSIIFCLLFSVASVCASDVDETAIASEDNTEIQSLNDDLVINEMETENDDAGELISNEAIASAEESILGVDNGTFDALRAKIDNATENSTVTLQNDYVNTEGSRQIVIDKSLTIDGNGKTIDCAGKTRIFYVKDGHSVIIKNLNIINGVSSCGGAIYCYIGTISVFNSNFTNNRVSDDYSGGTGGAIYMNTGTVTLTGCEFKDNYAYSSYMANGGAVFIAAGTLTANNCKFENNVVEGRYNYGGAIACTGANFIIFNSQFNNNSAMYGGAIHLNSGSMSINYSRFINNTAVSNGAIYMGGDTNLVNSIFINNSAQSYGGAFGIKTHASVAGCKILSNNAANGGAIYIKGQLTMSDTSLMENQANNNGGAVFFDGGMGNLTHCVFEDNNATNGGAIAGTSSNNYFDDSYFINNNATNGGAVYWSDGSNNTFSNCEFTYNTAIVGGAFNIGNNTSNMTVSNSRYKNNSATRGSVISAYNASELNIVNNTFYDISDNPFDCENGELDLADSKFLIEAIFKISTIPDFVLGTTIEIIVEEIKNTNFNGTVDVIIGKSVFHIEIINGTGKSSVTPIADPGINFAEVIFKETDAFYAESTISNAFVVTTNPVIKMAQSSVLYTGKYTVTVYDAYAKLAGNVEVVVYINGKKVKTVKTNSRGVAEFNLPKNYLPNKKYTIKATALGKSASKKVSVKQILTIKTVKVKKSAKKLVLTATLKKVDGKYLKNKKITFKFKGKKVKTVKTNSKGVAKVTITKKVLNKLKVGKKVTYQATYLKTTAKKTVKVKK